MFFLLFPRFLTQTILHRYSLKRTSVKRMPVNIPFDTAMAKKYMNVGNSTRFYYYIRRLREREVFESEARHCETNALLKVIFMKFVLKEFSNEMPSD